MSPRGVPPNVANIEPLTDAVLPANALPEAAYGELTESLVQVVKDPRVAYLQDSHFQGLSLVTPTATAPSDTAKPPSAAQQQEELKNLMKTILFSSENSEGGDGGKAFNTAVQAYSKASKLNIGGYRLVAQFSHYVKDRSTPKVSFADAAVPKSTKPSTSVSTADVATTVRLRPVAK